MFESCFHWLDRKLKVDAYELRGDEIFATGLPRRRIRLQDIRTWQSYYIGGGAHSISVELLDGRKVDFSDRFEDMYHILHEIAKDRELPFFTA